MKKGTWKRSASLVLMVGVLVTVGLVTGGGENMSGVGAGEALDIQGIKLAKYGSPVAVMGQLTMDGEPVQGTFFFLFYDPFGEEAKQQCGLQTEYLFPVGIVANGAQVSFIQYPNAVVTFNIAPSQFQMGYEYVLPFLPEDPPGAGALEFF